MKKIIIMGLLLSSVLCAQAELIVSVNYLRQFDAEEMVSGTETFGLVSEGTVVSNWNNTAVGNDVNIINNSGTATTVDLALNNTTRNEWAYDGLDNTVWRSGTVTDDVTDPKIVTVSDLNATFANGYYVIVYTTGNSWQESASITSSLDATKYYFQTPNSDYGTPLAITDTNIADGADVGNIIIYGSSSSGFTADSFTVTLDDATYGETGDNTARSLTAIAGIQIVAIPPSSPPPVVSINWSRWLTDDTRGDGVRIEAGDSWGLASEGTVVSNWNDTISSLTDGINNSGTATTVDASMSEAGRTTFGSALAGTAWAEGSDISVGDPAKTVTISDLNATFANGYYVILYVTGHDAQTSASLTSSLDATKYYYQTPNPDSTTPILITDTNVGDGATVGNYIIYGSSSSGFTNDSFTVTLGETTGSNSGIGGIQIVSVPTPGDGYPAWAVLNGLTVGVNDGLLDDAEAGGGDGVNNLLEYALGGDPLVNDAADILPVSAVMEAGGTNWFYYIQNRRTDDPSLSYTVLQGTDLVLYPPSVTNEPIGWSSEVDGFTTYTNRTDLDSSKEFLQLKVQKD